MDLKKHSKYIYFKITNKSIILYLVSNTTLIVIIVNIINCNLKTFYTVKRHCSLKLYTTTVKTNQGKTKDWLYSEHYKKQKVSKKINIILQSFFFTINNKNNALIYHNMKYQQIHCELSFYCHLN